ncbi:MAG TPA: helicase, partial [Planctomycetaceae bacterium]|nr:helicase [Planctomycetaceae bacterium]
MGPPAAPADGPVSLAVPLHPIPLHRAHGRTLELVQSTERKVPLTFQWVGDRLLPEQLEVMAEGDEETRKTPALVFCFNRNECWDVAETLKGRRLLSKEAQKSLDKQLQRYDWSHGAGPKLKRLLARGVGVHHAGLLPRYRRIVEELFQKKRLQVCVCTETLAAGINLPARSVVLSTLLKGAPGKKTLIAASSAHQMFGRAGRPQFDTRGYVFAMAHEDDVKILRWKEKYDQIPEDTKDPNLLRMKRQMRKKMPTRRSNQQYWNEAQFRKLQQAPPGKLASRGPLPWRLLAYLLKVSPEVDRLKAFCRKRLMEPKRLERGQKELIHMLMTLWAAGYVDLEPAPPAPRVGASPSP